MNVLHITKDIRFLGGAEIFLQNIIPHLHALGVNSVVYNLCPTTKKRSSAIGPTPTIDIPGPSFDFSSIRNLLRSIRDNRIDIIHTHLYFADVIGAALSALYPIPLVSTKYSLFPNEPSPATDKEIAKALFNVPSELAICARHDRIFAACAAIGRSYIAAGVPRAKVKTLHAFHLSRRYFASLYSSRQPAPRSPSSARRVITISRLVPGKGLENLIDAVPAVLRATPDVRFQLIGNGPSAAALRRRARHLGVARHISFPGAIPHADALQLLRRSDILVLPSHTEGLPLCIQEAMASGIPVVAADVGGVRELIPSQHHGRLVPPSHPNKLATAIIDLIQSPSLRHRLAKKAFGLAQSRFTAERTAEALLSEYRSLLARTRNPHKVDTAQRACRPPLRQRPKPTPEALA